MPRDVNVQIPVLTDALREFSEQLEGASEADREELIAELQTRIAASTFELTDEVMRRAFAEMEATVFEKISGRLRRELPEMIDTLLRERLSKSKNT